MTSKSSLVLAALCGLALVGAGCGDDNKTLSYDDTGAEIGKICDSVNFDELNGKPAHDAPLLDEAVGDFEDAVQDVRDLDVDDELTDTRDQFADNGDQQVAVLKQAQDIAETGNTKAYRKKLDEGQPLGRESDKLASKLGATACYDD
jgi:hypothetical protein